MRGSKGCFFQKAPLGASLALLLFLSDLKYSPQEGGEEGRGTDDDDFHKATPPKSQKWRVETAFNDSICGGGGKGSIYLAVAQPKAADTEGGYDAESVVEGDIEEDKEVAEVKEPENDGSDGDEDRLGDNVLTFQ